MILVTGASGFIGLNLVRKLVRKGHEVVCLVRRESNISELRTLDVKIVVGSITDKDSISDFFEGVGTVIHLAAVTSEVSSDYELSKKVNVEGTNTLLEISAEKGIERFVHLTSESTKRKIKGAYAQTKAEADEMIRKSGVGYIILRPSIVYGEGARGLFQKTLGFIESLPVVPIIGSGEQKIKPIYVGDVTDAIIASIESDKTLNREYDLTGAGSLTFNQFIDQIMEEAGIRKGTLHIPFSFVFYVIKLISLFIKNPPVTVDNLLGLKQEVDMSYEDATRDFGFAPKTFREGLRSTFYSYEEGKKNLAVIGMGKMGLLHASIITQIPGAKLSAIMDLDKSVNKQMRSLGFNGAFFTSVDDMMEKMRLDGVFICTPPSLNLSLSKKCIEKNISVFVEKPFSTDIESAKKMAELARSNNVTTSCGHMVAYNPVFQELKRLMENGEFGKLNSFESTCYISQVFRKKGKGSVWQYDPAKTGGGVLITMAGHLVFLLQWYFGQCRSVKGSMRSFFTVMDDELDAELVFDNGIEGSLKTSWSIKGYENLTFGIKVDSEKAMIEATAGLIKITDKGSNETREIHISALKDDAEFELGGKGYYAQDKDFINAIGEEMKIPTDWDAAFRTQQIVDAIYKSCKSNKEENIR